MTTDTVELAARIPAIVAGILNQARPGRTVLLSAEDALALLEYLEMLMATVTVESNETLSITE